MPILYHNTAIRSVFFNSSHLCYLRRQAKDAIAYMTVTEHIVIIEHAPVVITLVYWIIKAAAGMREEKLQP